MALLALTVMRLLPLALVVLVLTGCASTRQPGTLPPPTTLAEVNEVLHRERATVFFGNGRGPAQLYVLSVGPEFTQLSETGGRMVGQGRRYEWQPDPDPQIVPTADIVLIEIDDSLSAGQGAGKGLLYGASPGLVGMGVGGVMAATCEGWECLGAVFLLGGGAVATLVGGLGGAGIGAATTSRAYPVTVYQAPVSRYLGATRDVIADPSGSP